MKPPFLISNSFPLSLMRRRVLVEPRTDADLLSAMRERPWVSAWGHSSTVALASTIACADLRPKTQRPSVMLTPDKLPCLDGQAFAECWVLSPDYTRGYRPAIGEDVGADKIRGWQVLLLSWPGE